MALEQNLPFTTVQSRVHRALKLLYAALQAAIAAIILLVTKNARAQSARLAQQAPRLFTHAMQTTWAMTVTVACGVLVPASSLATEMPPAPVVAVLSAAPSSPIAVAVVPNEPPSSTEVEQSKPIALDMLEKQCFASRMTSNKIVGYLQGTVVPFAFLVAPAVTQLGCAGTDGHTPPPQEPDDSMVGSMATPYEMMCSQETRRGNDCPTEAEWYVSIGKCPDGTRDCQKK